MPKRSDTIETVLLAVELLRRIPRHRKVTARELHAQLRDAGIERELRTVQRQLEMLSAHFDIERDDQSKPYGYRWRDNATALTVPELSAQQSLLLHLAEDHLSKLLPAKLLGSLNPFFVQAKRNLGNSQRAQLESEWLSKVRVVATTPPLLPPKINEAVFASVSDALYFNHWLELSYQNASGKRTQAKVMPLGLAQQGPRLYLVCRFEGYEQERSLALHRIQEARDTGQPFTRPKEFDLKTYDDDGRFAFGEGQKIRLTFRITRDEGRHLLESPLSADQLVLELKNGILEIMATVVDSAMLDWWLRGFGETVTHVHKKRLSA